MNSNKERPLDEPYIDDEPMSEEDRSEATHIAIIDNDSPHNEVFGNVVHDDGHILLKTLYELCDGSTNETAGIAAKTVCEELFAMVKEGIE